MLWVAFDRGLRLAEKRCLPCPNRANWLATRDEIYEDIMTQGGYSPPTICLTANKVQATVTISAVLSRATSPATSSILLSSSLLSYFSSLQTIPASSEPWIAF
jgi:hypothetical protein